MYRPFVGATSVGSAGLAFTGFDLASMVVAILTLLLLGWALINLGRRNRAPKVPA